MPETKVYINLLNFRSRELAGAGVFAKSILIRWLEHERASPNPISFTILHHLEISLLDTFGIQTHWYKKVISRNISGLLTRIAYEQFIVPFHLKGVDLYFSPTPVLPFLARLVSKAKLVITIHDMIPFYFPKKYPFLRRTYVKWISVWGARIAHRVITVSYHSRTDICRLAGVDQTKVAVVYNFILNTFQQRNVETLENCFVCIATVEPGKNVENTILGFARFLEKHDPSYQLYWAGGFGWGYSRAEVERLVSKSGLTGRAHFLGFVSEEEKKNLLERCHSTVYLSFYEGFGLPVLESMTFNKPVLTSNSSSLPEVVGPAGVLCNPKDPADISAGMAELVRNREKYKKRIPIQIQKFSVKKQMKTFLDVINDVLNRTA